ncbi:MAG: sialate O-acetylesterase [Ruminococcaceae bacterium]|nr:sialate O-acetylesterase [Oscillospiraceae bacterium]
MTYDIIVFGGQSNMQGQTEGLPEINEPVDHAFEYKFLTDSLVPLVHPVGETVRGDLLYAPVGGCTTLLPDCCREYIRKTSRNVVAVHAARGATTIKEWLKGTERYDCSCEKILACIRKVKEIGEIGKIYYLWLQGESDAIEQTSTEEYMALLTKYKNDLKNDIGIDKFCLIEVGYFCTMAWIVPEKTEEDRKSWDEAIMTAQEKLPEIDDDFVMLTQVCKNLSLNPKRLNPWAPGHYNTMAMQFIGRESGAALAELREQ